MFPRRKSTARGAGENGLARREWLGVLVGVAGFAAVAAVGWKVTAKVLADMKRAEVEETRRRQVEELQLFQRRLAEVQKPFVNTRRAFREAFDKLARGDADAAQTRAALEALAAQCGEIQQRLADAPAPEGLPPAARRAVEEAVTDLCNGYGLWAKALGLAAACLDAPAPDLLDAAPQAQKRGDALIARGMEKLDAARAALAEPQPR